MAKNRELDSDVAACPKRRCRRAQRCRHAGPDRECIGFEINFAAIPARLSRLASIVLDRMEARDG